VTNQELGRLQRVVTFLLYSCCCIGLNVAAHLNDTFIRLACWSF